ncbi:MAG: hypothetical protein E7321_09390 [Clostridiales bacterium]|nr:hypothetical protein [Clostridiales bacterium]
MKKKPVLYAEAAYALGLVILALGTALMEKADFGMSMVVAPAYLLHLKLSERLPFFSFGMAEYVLQGVILVLLAIGMRRFKRAYLFSFVTAVLYGFALDAMLALVSPLAAGSFALRSVWYVLGMVVCSLGVALLLNTYISPEAYELFVKEIAGKSGQPIPRVKTAYDCVSCAIAVVMSFAFFGFGRFEGVKLGTILCALVNGTIIGVITAWLNKTFEMKDALKLRGFFAS